MRHFILGVITTLFLELLYLAFALWLGRRLRTMSEQIRPASPDCAAGDLRCWTLSEAATSELRRIALRPEA